MSLMSTSNAAIDVGRTGQQKRSTTEVDIHVGLMAKLRRLELEMSQEKLASKLGITAQQLKKYERGANRIGASRLHQLSVLLDVPIQYFFHGIDATKAYGNQCEGDDQKRENDSNPLSQALEDHSTQRLLKMLAEVRDPQLKNKIVGLVEAVIVRS